MILRNTIYVAVVALSLVGSGLASDVAAQAVAGPLAQADVPDSPVSKVAPKKKPHLAKTKIARAKAEKPKPAALEPWAAVDPGRVAPPPPPEAPLPPVDAKAAAVEDSKPAPGTHPELAMKWNGNNDTATQTRAQNYGGDAEGAGAAMGLKFHF